MRRPVPRVATIVGRDPGAVVMRSLSQRAPRIATLIIGLLVCGAASAEGVPSMPAAGVTTPASARPRVGLVLSGGGARGAAHAGVLKVLEEMHVPISCIAGTSMGAIVGASYASGTTVGEMETLVGGINTSVLFKEKPPRAELAIRRKQDDGINYIGPEVGVRGGTIRLQNGLVSGVALEAKLRQLSKAKGFYDFDKLPIPFRAVATDIETGEAVILKSGELANAMRASMSVPAAVAPAEIDGRKLVDGMLTRNLPVDVARQMCADVIIAVNVGTPLAKREDLNSILDITGQMISILTEQNVQRSLKELGPADVLITPDLDDFTTGDFDRLSEIIPRGEAAARKAIPELARYSIPEAEFRALRLRQSRVPTPDNGPVDEVRIVGLQRVNPDTVRAQLDTVPGKPLDADVLDKDMQRVYGLDDFEHVAYQLNDEGAKRVLTVKPAEKDWGPAYARVGLSMVSDLEGDSDYAIKASYRRTWLNALGAEWRSDVQFGGRLRLFTEFYQPLDPSAFVFVAPSFAVQRNPVDLYADDRREARYDIRTWRAQLDLGTQITRWGEIRLGLVGGKSITKLDVGPDAYRPDDMSRDIRGIEFRADFDQLDSVTFPKRGFRLRTDVFRSEPDLGADSAYTRWEAKGLAVTSIGNHTFQAAFWSGAEIDGRLPAGDQYSLGGFLQLSGLRNYQLYGREYRFGRLLYMNRVENAALLEGVYVGASLEAGKVDEPLVETNSTQTVRAGSLFLAADTPLGPVYLGYGLAEDGESSLYFYLGLPF